MNKKFGILAAALFSVNLAALPFTGNDITIHDGENYSNGGEGAANEDNETESGMVKSQEWDLEGFWLQDSGALAIVGGFDFKNGVDDYNGGDGEKDFRSGDIFIDVNGKYIPGYRTKSGNGQAVVNKTFGYEFVIDIDWQEESYDVIQLGQNSQTQKGYYGQNHGSNPWLYAGEMPGSAEAEVIGSGVFSYASSDSLDTDWVYSDWSGTKGAGFHNTAYDFDISSILGLGYSDLTFHNTMGCGNDNLMGYASVSVPEPSSVALLALGLIGLGVLRKRAV